MALERMMSNYEEQYRGTYNLVKEEQDLREDLREGISLRDHFAGLAMQGVLAMDDDIDFKYISSVAYGMADAMLEERSKGEKKR